jgi:glucose-6-phosphate 1-dehydrogenase
MKARAKDSLEKHGGLDLAAFEKLCNQLRYIDGDYGNSATFQALRKKLGSAKHPAHYLAIPPSLFGPVVEELLQSGCATGARVVVEKPFGDDLASARALIFAREDYVEEAWRIVDPVLKGNTPVYEYDPGSWGPKEVAQTVCPEGDWHNPKLEAPLAAASAGHAD